MHIHKLQRAAQLANQFIERACGRARYCLGSLQVTARLGADSKVRQSAEAELWFDCTHLQLFDTESGESLLTSNGAGTAAAQAPPASGSTATPS